MKRRSGTPEDEVTACVKSIVPTNVPLRTGALGMCTELSLGSFSTTSNDPNTWLVAVASDTTFVPVAITVQLSIFGTVTQTADGQMGVPSSAKPRSGETLTASPVLGPYGPAH